MGRRAIDLGPAYQHYVNDWRSSRATMRMTMAERGVYREMLDQQWLDGTLPDDPHAVADLLAITPAQVEEVLAAWPVVRRKFVADETDPNRIYNIKLRVLQFERKHFIRARRAAGKAGGNTRAYNRRSGKEIPATQSDSTCLAPAKQTASTRLVDPTSSSSSSSSSSCVPRARDVAIAEGLPRDHRSHATCGRVCVPAFLHRQFLQQLGGPEQTRDQRLRDWYLEILARIPDDQPIGDDQPTFWRRQFGAWLPSAAPASGPPETGLRRPPDVRTTLAQLEADEVVQ